MPMLHNGLQVDQNDTWYKYVQEYLSLACYIAIGVLSGIFSLVY